MTVGLDCYLMNSATIIAVIDNGICNLRSVTKALEVVGASPRVVRTPDEVRASGASGLVLPGVEHCVTAWRHCAQRSWT